MQAIKHKVVYFVMDPALGERSNCVIYSVIVYQNRMTIIGAEDVNMSKASTDDNNLLIRSHFVALDKRYPGLLQSCLVCPVIESNGSTVFVNSIYALLTSDTFPVRIKLDINGIDQHTLRGGNENAIGGIFTKQESKEIGVRGLCDLAMNNMIVFVDNFASSRIMSFSTGRRTISRTLLRSHDDDSGGEPLAKMRQPMQTHIEVCDNSIEETVRRIMDNLERQMNALRRTEKGEITGKGSRKTDQDDLAIALLIVACFVARLVSLHISVRALWGFSADADDSRKRANPGFDNPPPKRARY